MWSPARLSVLLGMLGVCAFLLFYRLPETPVFGDETVYIQVGARALRTGQWAPILIGKTVFAWKPPLAVWGNALGMGLLGENELGARLAVSLIGLLLCALVARFALRLGNTWTLLIAPLALISAPPLLLEHGLRSAVPEVWLMLAVALSFFHYLESIEKGPWNRLGGLALLSMFSGWTKGLVGPLIAGGTLFLVELASPPAGTTSPENLALRLRRATTVAAAATLPGILFYLAWLHFSLGSVSEVIHWLQFDVLQRAGAGIDPLHLQPPGMYARAALDNFGFFALVAPLALAGLLFRDRQVGGAPATAERRVRLTLLLWIVVTFVLFAVPSSRLSWYVYPAYPALAIAVALALDELRRWLSRRRAGAAIFLLLLILLGAARVRSLVRAWPEREPHSLAALRRFLEIDPAARAYTEAALVLGSAVDANLPGWHRYYLRQWVLLEERLLPADAPTCSFVVTTDPASWTPVVGGRLSGIARVRGSLPGHKRLFVLDLCGGRFATVKEWPE